MHVKEKLQNVVRMMGLLLALSVLLLTEACTTMSLGGKFFNSSEKELEVKETEADHSDVKNGINTADDFKPEFDKFIPDEVTLEVQSGIKEANNHFEKGYYRQAIRKYDELLTRFQSEDKRLETALLTNMALAYLEEGDQEGFARTTGRLVEASRGLKHLSRETQVLLKLIENMDGLLVMSQEDQRIERRINDTLSDMFGKESDY